MPIIARLREIRRNNEQIDAVCAQLDATGQNWRHALETDDVVSLDPATLMLLFKLLLLFLKILPLLAEVSSEE